VDQECARAHTHTHTQNLINVLSNKTTRWIRFFTVLADGSPSRDVLVSDPARRRARRGAGGRAHDGEADGEGLGHFLQDDLGGVLGLALPAQGLRP
jgi:hypothetical protein